MPDAVSSVTDRPLMSVRHLAVHFDQGEDRWLDRLTGGDGIRRLVRAVDDVSFDVHRGETLGLVGESGCGKTTLGRALLRLVPVTHGEIWFDGVDLATISGEALRRSRRRLQIVFQDPYASLNPRMTIGDIIAEPISNFQLATGAALEERVQALLETVGLDARYRNRYPHEFSGGQQQRIGIARALSVNPDFIVADEPISALDVSIQAQIINLIEDLQASRQLTYLFISHDLRAVRHTADRVMVMYLGKIVEIGPTEPLYQRPLMPYTQALVSAIPVPNPSIERARKLLVLEGDVPSPVNLPSGCRFHTRCPYAVPECAVQDPPLVEIAPDHFAACLRIDPDHPDISQQA